MSNHKTKYLDKTLLSILIFFQFDCPDSSQLSSMGAVDGVTMACF